MSSEPVPLRSQPGIKRDGTKFDGDFYTDGQWVRFQRGLPRKILGYRSINKYLSEISRGFTSFTQQGLQYCHSGGPTTLERFTIDSTKNSSIISDRTPGVAATGTVTLTGGAGGSVDNITVNGVSIMSGAVAFDTDLATTAANVAADINGYTSTPNYTAVAVGPVITITAVDVGTGANGYVLVSTATTITTADVNMSGGETPLEESVKNRWMFQYSYDASTTENMLIAHVAPNGGCICNDVGGQIFAGTLTGTAKLTLVPLPSGANATGGIVMLHPYLFYYGTAGIVGWSVPGEPTDLSGTGSNTARVWGQKIIKGMPLRGGSGSAPAGLFWAYDAVIRATFVGSDTIDFAFDVIATDTSIMSSDSVVDYDGVFYWAGTDRFLMFNGVVRDVPNTLNLNWFFDNIHAGNRSKVFAFKVPRYGEIWWCYPRGDATECTHAVIFNVKENTWYDTELPASGRSAGGFNNAFAAPIIVDAVPSASGYRTWIHEQGLDEIDGQTIEPIRSYFETADLSSAALGKNQYLSISAIEPDFVQSGQMTVQITGRANARAPEVTSSAVTFPATANEPYEQIVVLKEQRRELRVRFESNAVNGDYQMGQVLGHIDRESGDRTMLG